MEALIVVLFFLFLIWWLKLDKPIRSLSRSVNTLASAGEVKAISVLSEVAEDVEPEALADAKSKLEILRSMDL